MIGTCLWACHDGDVLRETQLTSGICVVLVLLWLCFTYLGYMHGPGANAAGMIIVQAIMSCLYCLGPFTLSSTLNSGGGCASGCRHSHMICISSADSRISEDVLYKCHVMLAGMIMLAELPQVTICQPRWACEQRSAPQSYLSDCWSSVSGRAERRLHSGTCTVSTGFIVFPDSLILDCDPTIRLFIAKADSILDHSMW